MSITVEQNSQTPEIPQTGYLKYPGGAFATQVSEKMLPLHCKAKHWFVLNYNQDEVTCYKVRNDTDKFTNAWHGSSCVLQES